MQDKRQIKNTDNEQTKQNPEKSKQRKTEQNKNYTGLVTFYDTRPRNKVGLFCNVDDPTQGAVPTLIAYLHPTTQHSIIVNKNGLRE